MKQSKYLGDCYFISALSIISQDDGYLRGFFLPSPENMNDGVTAEEYQGMRSGLWPPIFHFLAQYGIYVIRFFKNFKWRYVVIDDRIPCKEGGEIIYARCKMANELWVPLIEKAYAKLHNCYQQLVAGDIGQALADMSGMMAGKKKRRLFSMVSL